MNAPLLVVSGTGTGIGKTHVASALLRAWAAVLAREGMARPLVAGLKPVESGVAAGVTSDAAILEQASTFHVKRFSPPYMLARAVSPHLAAADEGRQIELQPILRYVRDVQAEANAVVVELPGGLFSPLAAGLSNADVASAMGADALLLVVPDRLGVLHDVAAATRAASAMGLPVAGLVVVAPDRPDASTGTNARELCVVSDGPVMAVIPRADVEQLAAREDLAALVRALVR
jgi:dethiobiotin synthetase